MNQADMAQIEPNRVPARIANLLAFDQATLDATGKTAGVRMTPCI